MALLVMKLTESAVIPTRVNETDAGYDLYSDVDLVIPQWSRSLISTGIAIAIPPGCYGRVASRSGLSCINNLDVGAGVVDRGYRGDIKVCLINSSNKDFKVCKGMKIAQLVCEKVAYPEIVCVTELSQTSRGINGFGSSGNWKCLFKLNEFYHDCKHGTCLYW